MADNYVYNKFEVAIDGNGLAKAQAWMNAQVAEGFSSFPFFTMTCRGHERWLHIMNSYFPVVGLTYTLGMFKILPHAAGMQEYLDFVNPHLATDTLLSHVCFTNEAGEAFLIGGYITNAGFATGVVTGEVFEVGSDGKGTENVMAFLNSGGNSYNDIHSFSLNNLNYVTVVITL